MTATLTPGRPAAPGGQRRTWHVWANAVVLVYVLAAVLAVIGHAHLPVPRWLAVHLLLLGGATNAIVTWTEHFSVALLRSRQPSRPLSAARLAGLNLGIVGVLAGISVPWEPVVIAGAALLAAVVVLHLVSLLRTARRALTGRFARTIDFYVVAGLFLVAGVTFGVVLSTMSGHGAWHEQLHAAHVHANVFGWVTLTVLGTLFTLWPTVLRTRITDGAMVAARRSLWLLTIGLAIAVTGLALGLRWLAVAALVLYLAGVVLALAPFVQTGRRKTPKDVAAWSLAAGAGWLVIGIGADAILLALSADTDSYLSRFNALVPPLAVGFVLQTLVGALSYLIPVIHGGGPTGVRATIAELGRWALARVIALNLGVLLVLASVVAGDHQASGPLAKAGWALVLVCVLAFLALTVRAVTPAPSRVPLSGVALGVVMTVLAAGVAVSTHQGASLPSSVSVPKTGAVQEVQVSLVSMDIRPAVITVAPGTRLRLVVTNYDAMRHDLAFANGPSTPLLGRGEQATLDLGTVNSAMSGWCTVPGHRAAGMTLDILLKGSAQEAKPGTQADGTGAGHDGHGSMDAGAAGSSSGIDVHGEPGPGWKPYDATLPPAPSSTVHRITLHIIEKTVEVAPGVQQRVWTFGGTVPAPTLRGRVGDVFEVTLINDADMEHGIDFHAGQNAPDEVMRSLEPGQSLVYRFTAQHSGAWLYHCSTMPMAQHIANGMYGAVIIDPPNLPKVDREYLLIGAQLYVGTPDGGADPARIRQDQWDAAMFNGYPDQYVHAPLTAKVGERVRWWVVAAGPNEGVAFHIVGTQFDTVFKEGAYLLRPGNPEHGASQVLDLAPAQGGFVEQTFVEPGHYVLIDHDMRRGEAGAHGIIDVTR